MDTIHDDEVLDEETELLQVKSLGPAHDRFCKDDSNIENEGEFSTNVISVSEYRRSWPQTVPEIELRYGVSLRRTRKIKDAYGWNRLYESETPIYDVHKQILNWEQLPEERIASLNRSCVWNGGSGLFNIDINAGELDRVVERFDPDNGEKRRSTRRDVVSVLTSKRATVVSVSLRKLLVKPPRLAKLGLALRQMNDAYFDESKLDLFEHGNLWPTADELHAIKGRIKAGYALADPDAFLWFLAVAVPNVRERVQAMRLRFDFDEWSASVFRATGLIKSASMEVCTSDLLRRVLGLTLMIGNRINSGHGGHVATKGITLRSLSKLPKIKTADKMMSVLDCIVEYIQANSPELLEVADECTCVTEASRYSLNEQLSASLEIRQRLAAVRTIGGMEEFFKAAMEKLDKIENDLAQAKRSFKKALDYFAVSPTEDLDTDSFFSMISDFFMCIEQAVDAREARERLAAVQSRPGHVVFDQTARAADSTGSMGSKASTASTRLSIFKRPSRSTSTSSKKTSIIQRQSIFGRMRPSKET